MNTSRGIGGPLADIEATLVEVGQKPSVRVIERRTNRTMKISVIVCLLFTCLAIAWAGVNTERIVDTRAQQVVNNQAIADLREANELREEAGLRPIPLPPPGEPVDVSSVIAAAASLVLEDVKYDHRFHGPSGPSGEACLPSLPGCTGPQGLVGPGGPQGPVGPQGEVGTQGPPGPQGAKGDQGDKGDPCVPEDPACVGPKGDTGQQGPGPVIFTFEFQGTTYTCSDPDQDLMYQCR